MILGIDYCLHFPPLLVCLSRGCASPCVFVVPSINNLQVNLRHGVQRGESLETCSLPTIGSVTCNTEVTLGTAGAGSLILELATLSRLTGDDRFEKAAYKAFFALWNRRSDIGLVGNTINIWTGVSSA